MTFDRQTLTTTYTEAQQDANWDNLSSEQRAYFNHLADGDSVRTGQAFFEDTVPVQLQDDPEKLEVFLNGGTVTTTEFDYTRGRAGGEYVQVEHEVSDRDWSHDVSRANGGSDSASNGRWEDASTNRARGSANTTPEEQAAADRATARDADVLEEGEVQAETFVQHLDEVGEASAWAAGAEVAGGFLEATLDGLLPVVGGAVVAKKVYEHFEEPQDKVGWSAAAGGATVWALCTPPGQLAVGCWVVWKLGERGVKLWNKHVAA